ncbi:IS110 family transposase [Hypericibacter adhaerens]|jgi:transposase|uniref:IS110 family transposase n=1 Tax=Hypericibacter adhaerens TaxID=2602016 RepID=A0A5J6MXE9_9PROT|nr:IS110 family transposase [Hypericibacter adhaerens]QEX20970.1 IS110 family transposase [Hypericibacter adhaerens]QEX21465.1 IS110 family transposase [Hypericibacter adhaerens]QEX21623.1 IS110 family transposase [Hypericibacter adhaerens]QEX21772.1 IS110 family transposase [Hypericibacter adhaerens]QEX22520.1 IS110 family transposase [Hypericibacter adhaerens]
MSKSITETAGIDVSKRKLDVALAAGPDRLQASNDPAGYQQIESWLREHGVERVGLEASGHYEAAVAAHLRRVGFCVVLLDPAQVKGFRRFKKKRAKNDKIDARLIAVATADMEPDSIRPAPDERLAPWAEHLTLIEQIGEDISRLKTRRDRYSLPAHKRYLETEITRLSRRRDREIVRLLAKLRRHPDLALKLDLLESIPGLGPLTALSFVLRMPELGRMTRAEAAALVGVAPFDDESGEHTGERHIAGGRKRLRRSIYQAAFSASQRWNPILLALYKRLIAKGKHHKVATVACARKLVEIANAILARATPWQDKAVTP